MKRMKKSNTLAIATLGVAVAAATPLVAQESLNFAYGYPSTSAIGLAVQDYAAAVAERSDGNIDVTGFPMTLLSSTLYIFSQVQVQKTASFAMNSRASSSGRMTPPMSPMSSHLRLCDQ